MAVAGVIIPLDLDTGRKESPHQTVRTRLSILSWTRYPQWHHPVEYHEQVLIKYSTLTMQFRNFYNGFTKNNTAIWHRWTQRRAVVDVGEHPESITTERVGSKMFFGLSRTNAAPNFADYGEGQKGNLWEHAFAAATRLNLIMMDSRNISQNETFEGYRVPTNRTSIGRLCSLSFVEFGGMFMDVPSTSEAYLAPYIGGDLTFGSPDLRGIAGIPNRLDHRDSRRQGANVAWYQPLHVCASATKLAIQTLECRYNGTIQRFSDLNIKRDPENIQRNVLWGMEKLDSWSSVYIEPVYGKVNDE
ncbi:hypothetical protein BT69DRAFT_1297861 [Atractiella rhizophila]|nr:hypothetical protein BT69DRAFT_1297861 [Atractiella rhizophila]